MMEIKLRLILLKFKIERRFIKTCIFLKGVNRALLAVVMIAALAPAIDREETLEQILVMSGVLIFGVLWYEVMRQLRFPDKKGGK